MLENNMQELGKSRNTPLLSVVMPVHNPHQYLSPCIESVLQQTFKDFELITIDDASSDDSYAILQEYAKRDKRMQVLQNEQPLGAAPTRNRGLHIASGKYIIFLDADDFFELDFFEKMLSAIESAKADVAICAILLRDEYFGNEVVVNANNSSELEKLLNKPFHPSDFHNKVFYCTQVAPFNKIIRKEFLLEKRIEFQNISNCNDVYFGVMTLAEASKIVYLSKPFIHYRSNTGCQISTNRFKKPLCICHAYQKIREELIARGLWKTFYQMYYDRVVREIHSVVQQTREPEILLEYIHGEDGKALGLRNLQRCDFSSIRTYGLYQVLFYGKKAIMGDIPDIIACLVRSIRKGDIFVPYWILGHYFMNIARRLVGHHSHRQ